MAKKKPVRKLGKGKVRFEPGPPGAVTAVPAVNLLRLDLGCGPNPAQGFLGVDKIAFKGVGKVMDLAKGNWPWTDNSVDEVVSNHFLEHLDGAERIVFFNELGRVMKPGAKATIRTPVWKHDSAYGDPTHKWPPISPWTYLYLNKVWREGAVNDQGQQVAPANAPHVPYTCDFDVGFFAIWDEWLNTRAEPVKMFAMDHYTNGMRDLTATLAKRA